MGRNCFYRCRFASAIWKPQKRKFTLNLFREFRNFFFPFFDSDIIFHLFVMAKHAIVNLAYYAAYYWYRYIRISTAQRARLIFRDCAGAHRRTRVDSIAVSRKQVHRFIIYRRYSGHLIKNILRTIPLSVWHFRCPAIRARMISSAYY